MGIPLRTKYIPYTIYYVPYTKYSILYTIGYCTIVVYPTATWVGGTPGLASSGRLRRLRGAVAAHGRGRKTNGTYTKGFIVCIREPQGGYHIYVYVLPRATWNLWVNCCKGSGMEVSALFSLRCCCMLRL